MNTALRLALFVSFSTLAACASTTPTEQSESSESHLEKGSAARSDDQRDGTLEEGDVCNDDKQCGDGLSCLGAPDTGNFTGSYCQVPPGEEGDVCNDDQPCGEGLSCLAGPDTGNFTGAYCQK